MNGAVVMCSQRQQNGPSASALAFFSSVFICSSIRTLSENPSGVVGPHLSHCLDRKANEKLEIWGLFGHCHTSGAQSQNVRAPRLLSINVIFFRSLLVATRHVRTGIPEPLRSVRTPRLRRARKITALQICRELLVMGGH